MNVKSEIAESFTFSLITQGKYRMYSLTIPIEFLARTCFVTRREENPNAGFQRTLDEKRAKEIASYIDHGGTIPNAIILSAQPEIKLKEKKGGRAIELTPHEKGFLILDGQHRVYGYRMAKTKLRVPVIIYNNLSLQDECRLFIDINTRQRPVPNELLLDIKHLAETETNEEEMLRSLFDLFYLDNRSALLGLTSPAKKISGKLTRVSFNDAISGIISLFDSRDPEKIYDIVNNYLHSISRALSDIEIDKSVITNPIYFRAICSVFPDIARRVKDKYSTDVSMDRFLEFSSPMISRTQKKKHTQPGSSYKSLAESFRKALLNEPLF